MNHLNVKNLPSLKKPKAYLLSSIMSSFDMAADPKPRDKQTYKA